jgi:peptidoglycan/xylan/chitin deacetylase (PgdA/CDA1 family)
MYHYVRDLPNTPYPRIAGLLTSRFEGQLDYIERHYRVVGAEDVVHAVRGDASLPPNACHLTFDDGFVDHYETVLPRLAARGLRASFYPPAAAVLEHKVLDVHKIHFLLAAEPEITRIKGALLEALAKLRDQHALPSDGELYAHHARAGRFDGPDVIFVKRLLQVGLPEEVRRSVTDELFSRFVTDDEPGFAKGLYLSLPQLREMLAQGMSVGGHGYTHAWLGALSRTEQELEIRLTRAFLEQIHGAPPRHWVMCYPHGSHNPDTLELLRDNSCEVGLTTRVGLSDLERPLELARLDTNDLPCAGAEPPCEWTRRA